MELRQLRYLAEVASAGSLGKAAQRLYIAQSAISRQIAELEDELGVVLLRRSRGGVALTDAGQRFVEGSAVILRSLQDLRVSVSASTLEPQQIRIGLPPTVSPLMLRLMSQDLPSKDLPLRMSVIEGSTYALQRRLESGDLDCAILTNPVSNRSYSAEPLWRENLFLVGNAASMAALPSAANATCTLDDIADLPLALTPPGDASRLAIELAFENAGLSPNVRYEHEAPTFLRAQLELGVAFSLLSQTVAHAMGSDNKLVAKPVEGLSIERAFVVRRGSLPQEFQLRLAQMLRESVVRHYGVDPWIQLLAASAAEQAG